MAGAFSQFAFLGHDSGHRQVFRSVKRNDMLMMLAALVTGMAPSWWQDKHVKHHVSPNRIGHDGDIEISVFAFTRGQALESGGVARFFVRHQAFWFYPMLMLTSYSLLFAGVAFLARRQGVKHPVLEPIVVATAVGVYLALVFTFLPFWHGVLFIVVHRALTGLHLGSVFAPNHKGMPNPDAGYRDRPPAAAGADVEKRHSQPGRRLHVRRVELPDRASPLSQHAPQSVEGCQARGQGFLC